MQIFCAAKRSAVPIYKCLERRRYLITRDSRKARAFSAHNVKFDESRRPNNTWNVPHGVALSERGLFKKDLEHCGTFNLRRRRWLLPNDRMEFGLVGACFEESLFSAQHQSEETGVSELFPTPYPTSHFSQKNVEAFRRLSRQR